MWRGLSAVLAFTIRPGVFATGRAAAEPRLSAVNGLATRQTSPISTCSPMTKRSDKFDNHFSPSRQADEGLLTGLIFATSLIALALGTWTLFRLWGAI